MGDPGRVIPRTLSEAPLLEATMGADALTEGAPGHVSGGCEGAVEAVVVDYRAGDHLRSLVTSLVLDQAIARVVVVDNSTDGSTERALSEVGDRVMERVEIVASPENVGFGAAVNLGVARTTSPLVLVSNPDVVVKADAIRALRDAMESDSALGVVGPALLEADGRLHQSARVFPTVRRSAVQALLGVVLPESRAAGGYREANWQRAEQRYIDWVSGAFFLIRRRAFAAAGGFDPGYFLYVEEVDLCWRMRRAGYRAAYVKKAEVVHIGGVSGAARPYATALAHHRSLLRFARRTAEGRDRYLLPLVAVGLCLRCILVISAIALRGGRRPQGAGASEASA